MKAVILGDIHYGSGYSLGKIDNNTKLNSRLIDFSNTFDYVIDHMISSGVKHLIITGDIYEARRPQAVELSLFSKKIQRLSELGIHTHIVVGNHDLIKDQKVTTVDVLNSLKLSFMHVYSDIECITISDDTGGFNAVFIPFRTTEMLDCENNDAAVNRIKERVDYELKKVNNNFPVIVVGHLMLDGTMIGNTVLNNASGEVVLPQSMFLENIDAVIMGHVHPAALIRENPLMAYVGSMDSQDFNEAKYKKHFVLCENNNGNTRYKFNDLPVRKLYELTIDMSSASGKEINKNIIEHINKFSLENTLEESTIKINVTVNENCIYDLNKDIIKQELKQKYKIHHCIGIYPQILSVRQLRKSTITESQSSLEAFNEYLELETNAEIKEKLRAFGTKIITENN